MLKARNVNSGYGDLTVLRGISLDLDDGEILAVLGHNGVGKTTLLRTLMGVLPARGSEITFDGTDLTRLKPYQIANLGIAYVPQAEALFADLSVADNLRVAYGNRKAFDDACEHALSAFDRLRERFRQRAGSLSGGEQKMLLVARALLVSPRLILADEVTEGLQPAFVTRIAEVLKRQNREFRTSAIIVEQNLDFALDLADRFVLMKQGSIATEGRTENARSEIAEQLAL